MTQLISKSRRVPRQPDVPLLDMEFIDIESYRKVDEEVDTDGDDEADDDDDDGGEEEENDTD